jgi:hypothetical protein
MTLPACAGLVLVAICIAANSMVAAQNSGASPNGEHAAASVRSYNTRAGKVTIVAPHKAATLLPVVDQKDIQPNHQKIADETLRALPSFCRDNLKNFYVNYDKRATNRGLGGATTIIIIGTVPDAEFRALLIHECGHVTDIGGLRGTIESGKSVFLDGTTPIYNDDPSLLFYQISWANNTKRHATSKNTDFPSGYGASDPFEDFAESFAFFALQQTEFQRLAKTNPVLKAKYDFLATYVFANNTPAAIGTFVRGKQVPWDVTKLPYVWHAKK